MASIDGQVCGVAGRTITVQLNNGAPAWTAPWDNGAVHWLTSRQLIYLPLLRHTPHTE